MNDEHVEVTKAELVAALRERIEAQLAALTESQNATQAGASHAEARSEHPKDTRSTEAAYLARGLADRVGQLQIALDRLTHFTPGGLAEGSQVALGALVSLEDDDGHETAHFVVPAGGGEKLNLAGSTVHALSPSSPLGAEIMGRRVDEDFEVDIPRGRLTYTIVSLR